jgi:hypothetical protein
MNPKYYVAVRPRTNGLHGVHKEGCPFITCDEKVVYLGRFNSVREAEEEGLIHFNTAKCCTFCSKDIINRENHERLHRLTNIFTEAEDAFLCCPN